jgi:L-fuculose-phosphate aldolase
MKKPLATTRLDIVRACRKLAELGLMPGRSGNVSVRVKDRMWLTPSGLAYETMKAGDIVETGFDGTSKGALAPSSEWRLHGDIYRAFPRAQAIVHTHSPHATAYSCHRRDLPPFHYMIAVAGGDTIRCASYARFGTQALSDAMLDALQDRRACLLANHGQIVFHDTLAKALELAEEVETLCRQYLLAKTLGEPIILSAQEMHDVKQAFATYGQPRKTETSQRSKRRA